MHLGARPRKPSHLWDPNRGTYACGEPLGRRPSLAVDLYMEEGQDPYSPIFNDDDGRPPSYCPECVKVVDPSGKKRADMHLGQAAWSEDRRKHHRSYWQRIYQSAYESAVQDGASHEEATIAAAQNTDDTAGESGDERARQAYDDWILSTPCDERGYKLVKKYERLAVNESSVAPYAGSGAPLAEDVSPFDDNPGETVQVTAAYDDIGMAGDKTVEPAEEPDDPLDDFGIEEHDADAKVPTATGMLPGVPMVGQLDNRLSDPNVQTDVDEQMGDRGIARAPDDEPLRYPRVACVRMSIKDLLG